MARSRPEKKPDPAQPVEHRVLPMQLRVGDRLIDERGEWRVIGMPHTTLGGKTAHVRVELVAQPGVTEVRSWGAHERVSVKRAATAEEGQPMMRLARRASLPVALLLLASAATAHAECAWVLWSYSSNVDKYGIDSVHATRQECSKAVGDVTTMLKKGGSEVLSGRSGSYEIQAFEGLTLRRYICLLDTVDPRGPKGK